ncbi:MAG: phytanoyl-CoA dioxygenase family protein [Planctomycetes bacterium]|nr:phytanoyl-CoA dioxygenase family protein [Planctomycetota bacterium]
MPTLSARRTAYTVTLSEQEVAAFHRDGYHIARRLFSRAEIDAFLDHFMTMHARGEIKNYPVYDPTEAARDPLKKFPRVMHPHRWDERSVQWLLDARVADVLRQLLGEEPVAAQSMFYFKPPGARGQAFHQDNYYLRVRPKSCIAAWTALDRSDPENGGLQVCPGTHTMKVVCPERSDESLSFAKELVRPPEGCTPVPAILDPGDVLFFNGSVVHGSTPNASKDRFRRSYICHYAPESLSEIWRGYKPLLAMDGNVVDRNDATGGGPCGNEWGSNGGYEG